MRTLLLSLAVLIGASLSAFGQGLPADSIGQACVNGAPTIAAGAWGRVNCDGAGNAQTTNSVSPSGGGVASFSRIPASAATTNPTLAKAGAGRVYKIFACNTTTTNAYIRFGDTAVAPVPGTTPVYFSRPLPAAASAGVLACQSFDMSDLGWSFFNGIGYWLTAGAPDADTTALTAGAVVQISVEYR